MTDDSTSNSQRRPAPDGRQDAIDGGVIAHYRLLRELGRGGQGVVWLAEDLKLKRNVALKVLTGGASENSLKRFRREAEVASKLDHPNICAVHDAGIDHGTAYIAMRFVDGVTLTRKINTFTERPTSHDEHLDFDAQTAQDGSQSPASRTSATADAIDTILRLIEKTARALHAAHQAGIVHCDIKPGNIMVTAGLEPVITDFGLAREIESDNVTLTRTGDLVGTPAYMSPEQLLARRAMLDGRTDVYSLGVTLFECIAGRRPFEAATRDALYLAIQTKEAPDLRRLNPKVSADLAVVVATAIEKDRDRRYDSADAFADDLRHVREGEPIVARPVSIVGRAMRFARRRPAVAALIVVLVISVPTITALLTSYIKDRPQVEAARLAKLQGEKDEILGRASFELGEGDVRKAIPLYEQVLAMEGRSVEAAGGLILAHLKRKQPESALTVLDHHRDLFAGRTAAFLLEADIRRALGASGHSDDLERSAPEPDDFLDHYLLAERAMTRGHAGDKSSFEDALFHARRAVLLSSTPRAHLMQLWAHAAGHMKDAPAARDLAVVLRRRWPESAASHHWVGYVLSNTESPDDAIAAFREAIRISPTYGLAHSHLGDALAQSGLIDDAIAAYRDAIRLGMTDRAYISLGNALAQKGFIDDAIAAYREAIRIDATHATAHNNLGLVLRDNGLIDDAIAAFREAIRIDGTRATTHDNLGIALHQRGFVDDAVVAYREALRIDATHATAHYNLGVALRDKGLVDDAIAAYREAVRADPTNAAAHNNLGLALHEKGLIDDAIAVYREALRMDATNGTTYNNLAKALLEMGLVDDAIDALRQATRIDANNAMVYYNLGSVLHRKGLFDDAIAAYREAIRIDASIAAAHYSLGVALQEKGLVDGAITAYRAAIHVDSSHAEAHCNLGHCLVESGQYEEAVAALHAGHRLGTERPWWSHPSAEWVSGAEQILEQCKNVDRHVRAHTLPDLRERVALAKVALNTGQANVAAAWYRSTVDAGQTLGPGHWVFAARAALRAAATDGAAVTEAAAWRRWGLRWIEEELESLEDVDAAPAMTKRRATMLLTHADFASVREPAAVARLPEKERKEWTWIWNRVREIAEAVE